MTWRKENETADCAGKCGTKVSVVIRVRENGSRVLDLASTQAEGTHSSLNADGTWNHYCRKCFLVVMAALFKGMIVDDKERGAL